MMVQKNREREVRVGIGAVSSLIVQKKCLMCCLVMKRYVGELVRPGADLRRTLCSVSIVGADDMPSTEAKKAKSRGDLRSFVQSFGGKLLICKGLSDDMVSGGTPPPLKKEQQRGRAIRPQCSL
jgi:hypothetical protein